MPRKLNNFTLAQKHLISHLESPQFKKREDAESTQSSVPILQRIVELGFITDSSQEGLSLFGYNPSSKLYSRMEERAFVTGFMKHTKALNFVNWMNTYSDKIAFIIVNEPNKNFEPIWWETDIIAPIAVTVSGSSLRPEQIELPNIDTKLFTILPSKQIETSKKEVGLNASTEVDYIACFDPLYGRLASSSKGLYQDILNALNII